MNLQIENIKKIFSTKVIIQIYFMFFILLNVFDFFNYLSGDIDFFKKILSWVLIGYVFHKASFSRIFIGICDRKFDWLFMIGFCFIGIMKSLYHYISISNLDNFYVFGWFFKLFPNGSEVFLTYTFLIGVFIVIISSILLLKKYIPTRKSLIGSFDLSDYVKFIGMEYFILSFASLFFGLVVFNYVMEWFALAVDSIILVLGLIFYLFMFLHNHTKLKTKNLLSNISNTGNSFYQNLINQFSNKKTFMIGVSFILLLHLLVDIGVYLIPFLTGLKNTLYGGFVGDSVPVFNLFDFSNSQFYSDLIVTGFEPISFISLLIIYLSSIVIYFLFMSLPFYYFYKNISFKKFKLSNFVEILFIVSLLIQILVFALPSLNNPISIDWSFNSQIIGVDLNTSPILSLGNSAPIELIIILILSLVLFVESKYLVKSSINNFISKKIVSGLILLFFFGYILVFAVTTISNEFENTLLKNNIVSNVNEFDAIMVLYENSKKDPYNRRVFATQPKAVFGDYDLAFTPFSTYDYKNLSNDSIDFLIYTVSNINTTYNYDISNHKTNVLFDGELKKISQYFDKENFTFIYKLGENKFIFENKDRGFTLIVPNLKDYYYLIKLSAKSKMTGFVEIIRLVILFVFYFGGLVVFSIHFYNTNIRRS